MIETCRNTRKDRAPVFWPFGQFILVVPAGGAIEVHPGEMDGIGRRLLAVLVSEGILRADEGADQPSLH